MSQQHNVYPPVNMAMCAAIVSDERLNGKVTGIGMLREYNTLRDSVQFALFFRDSNLEKRRVDFEVFMEEVVRNKDDMEDYVMRQARAAIMKELDGEN